MKTIIETDGAPKAIGPYSQAVKVGPHLYCAGQIGMHPDSGELVSADVAEQARQVFKNIIAVLEAAGGNLLHVVNVQIFLTDMANQYALVNEVMQEFFEAPYPARAAVEVSRLPKDAKVEVVVDAFLE